MRLARWISCATALIGAASISSGAQARWSLVENLRIGSEEEGPYLFSQIRGIAVGEGGSVFVLDARAQEIRLFDSQGKFVRRVARGGAGPGEIRNANGLLTAPDGRVWVNDPNNSRYSIFTPRGDFATQHRYSPWGFGYYWQAMFDRSGSLLEYVSVFHGNVRQAMIRRVSPDGAKVDTIALPECANRASKEAQNGYQTQRGQVRTFFSVPFVPAPLRAWDPGGFIWCTSNDRYEILKIKLISGDTLMRVRQDRAPIPVTDSEREAAIAPIRSAFARAGQPAPDFGLIPRVKPALQNIDVDDQGRLWVRATSNDTTRTVFEVWDGSTGRLLANVTAPWEVGAQYRPLIRGDTLYTVITDENDVPMVVRAIIRR
ncbi:MAG TPA: 6-bladed beta-propeller [Gemmatimonadaceae bacterium]